MEFEKKYWSKGEYKKNGGIDYEGYVGIFERNGYVFDTSELLIKNDNYEAQINSSKYFFDRILDEELVLPFSKEDVVLQANDFVYTSTLKTILTRLQENNDYIFKSAILSNTLIPNVENTNIIATADSSHYIFLSDNGSEILDENNDPNGSIVTDFNIDKIIFINNPNYDITLPSLGDLPKLSIGDLAKKDYGNYFKIPKTDLKVVLENGKLKTYKLTEKKTTRTKLDPTFYPIVKEDGILSEPLYNFNNIINTEIVITDIIEKDNNKIVKLLIFLLFNDKLVIFKYDYYPDNFNKNTDNPVIDFTKDVLVLTTVNPTNKNALSFLHLRDIRIKNNYMFLVDDKLNMVLRYDITYLLKSEESISYDIKSIKLLDLLQGDGNLSDDIYFNRPISVDSDENYIYVADQGNNCIKVYSSSFDYVKTIKNGYFTRQLIENITVNPYSMRLNDGTILKPNSLWIYSTTNTSIHITVISDGTIVYYNNIKKIRLLEDKWSWKEEFKNVKFSFNNSNYYYISTTKRVYKIHLTKPDYPFASLSYFKQRILLSTMVWSKIPYPWHILPSGTTPDEPIVTWGYRPPKTSAEILDNKGFTLIGNSSTELMSSSNNEKQFNGDIIFHIGNLYDQSKIDEYLKSNEITFDKIPDTELSKMINCSGIFLYNERASFISSLTKLDIPSYISEDIEDIKNNEYINSLTFNKLIYKIIYNLVNIKNILMGSFVGGYNLDNLMVYDELKLNDFFQQLRIENNDNFFIHDNEPSSIVINRIFEELFEIQNKILKEMQTRYIAQPAFTNNSFKII